LLDSLGLSEKAKSLTNTYWGYLGDPPRDLNAMHFISLLAAYVEGRPSMPYDRSHGMSLAMVKVFQDCGGEVWYNSLYDNIVVTKSSFTIPFPTEDVVYNVNMASDGEIKEVENMRETYKYNF
jgi:hypothetical protein